MLGDDLVPLLVPEPATAVGFRQGVVVSWNPETAENTIRVGGSTLTNLTCLNTSEAKLIVTGSVVGILTTGTVSSSWFVLGRITIPGTPEAASALDMVRTESATVFDIESTTSGSYADLATVGPTVTTTVGRSGRCLVTVGAEIHGAAAAGAAIATGSGYMSFALSGANIQSAIDDRAVFGSIRYDATPNSTMALDLRVGASRVSLLTGLIPGETTFTAKYRRDTGTSEFADRNLTVVLL